MKRTLWVWALVFPALACGVSSVSAQGAGVPKDRGSWTRGMIHYGKWVTAAGAIGLTVMGAKEHSRSAREWDQLVAMCRANNAACTLASDGRYVSTPAELHYQLALYYDRRANRRLLGGQLSLLATGTMFLLDLRRAKSGPNNIPFAPLQVSVSPSGEDARVGLRFAF